MEESKLFTSSSESTIQVAWIASSDTKSAKDPYMLYIEPEDAEENYLTVFNPGNPGRAEFVGLEPNTEYQIRLVSNLGLSLSASQKTSKYYSRPLHPVHIPSVMCSFFSSDQNCPNFAVFFSLQLNDL